ncbi:MAG: DUF4176 domain-containing protein [Eubacteriales bacterium]
MKLYAEYLERKEVTIEQSRILQELGALLKWEYEEVFSLYLSCAQNKDYLDSAKGIEYQIVADEDVLMCHGKRVVFKHKELLELLAVLCDLVEEILPVGSVVVLKKEFLTKIPGIENVDQFRLVITNRFLLNNESTFHTYAGSAYPISNFNGKEVMCFSKSLIDQVVFLGFSDEQEEAYVSLMKYELIMEKGKHSAGLSAVNK